MKITLEEQDVLEYVESEVANPPENSNAAIKAKYKKGEVKAKRINLDSLRDHLITYVSNLKKSKEMYDKLNGKNQVNNLSQVLTLKNQLKDIKMNRGETIQAYFMRISKIKDQLSIVGEIVSNKKLVLITLRGLSPTWETFITTINNNDKCPTFNDILRKCIKEKARIISRIITPTHEEGEPRSFFVENKGKRGKLGHHFSRNLAPRSSGSYKWNVDL